MVDYGYAIKRPFTDLKKLAIGIVLSIIPIVNFITLGYALYCGKNPLKGLPEWKNWGDLFLKGLVAIFISLIFALPALIVIFFGIGTAALTGVATGDYISMLAGLNIVILLGIILALFAAYITPAALMNYIHKGKFMAAFDFGKLKKDVLAGQYLVAWLVALVYGFVISLVIIGIFMFIPIDFMSLISGGISRFIVLVTMYTIVGQVVRR